MIIKFYMATLLYWKKNSMSLYVTGICNVYRNTNFYWLIVLLNLMGLVPE